MIGKKIRLSGGFHNDIFYIEGEEVVERIPKKKRKSKEMVLQEIEWMDFLYKNGVSVSKPKLNLVETEGQVKAYFEFIKGEPIDVTNKSHWNSKNFKEFGRILGRMHRLSKEFKVGIIYRPVWTNENPDVFDIRDHLSQEIKDIYDSLMGELFSMKRSEETYGLIHNDFHQGNMIISDEGIVTIIDFDECSFNWFAQDIAVFFYHAYWQQVSFNEFTETFYQEFLKHFFAGYQSENSLHIDVIRQIPVFLKLREIYLYQLFLQEWDRNHMEEWQTITLIDLEDKIKSRVQYAGINDFSPFI